MITEQDEIFISAELKKFMELRNGLREYLDVMATEPEDSLIPLKKVYHDLKRMMGDEV